MRPKLKDIADRVGVSAQLVSFYLNHPDTTRVKKETRERIDRTVRELNYRTNIIGRALSTGRTFTIGLIMGGFAARKRGCYVHALMNEAKKRGYHLLIMITNYDHDEEREALEVMIDRQVDGIIYTLDLADDSETAQRLQTLKFPLLLHSPCIRNAFETIGHDYRQSTGEMVRFLADRGRKSLCVYTTQEGELDHCLRLATEKHSLELTTVCQPDAFDDIEKFCRLLMQKRPDAILVQDHANMKDVLETITADAPEYRPDCISSYSLPFESINHPLMAGYIFRHHTESAAIEIDRIIQMIENPDAEFRHPRCATRFMTAEEIRELRNRQLEQPMYRQFK